ncbi:unnamed protein product [Clonostachys byssicola]|uniref:NACHT domain-containing protein n=1 Tax=Clonostachys byssicola TaxID=160290 RepID=A0A9N9XY73_9HYPO|nr:unnamed protein product [Clonostachys byssicola]
MAEIFGLAVNVATVFDLFIKVGVQCSEYCASVKAARPEVRSILKEADRLAVTLGEVNRLLDSPNGPKVEASQNIRSCVEDCRLQWMLLVVKLQQGMEAMSLKWPFKKGEVAGIITRMERCRTSMSLDLQIHQATQIASVHHEIILAKLRTVERAGFDAHSDADNARCYQGTRTNLINQVLAWVDSDNSKTIFWLNGMAGTGKSTIARTISQELADKNKLGASFFFKRGEGDRGRATFFFPTIATQLARQIPSLAPFVRNEVEADPSINNKALSDQFDSLIVKPIQRLPKASQRQTLAIVVDALDECDYLDNVKRIIHLLSQVKNFSHICLKAFVTSRPELPIQLGFNDIVGEYTDLLLQDIPKPIIENDITVFLEHELAVIRLDYNKARPNRPLPPSWPGPEQIQRLVEMAIPLFIFAATVCRFIQDRRLGGPRDQLERILKRQGDQKSKLDATYLPVLDRLLAGLNGSQKNEVVGKFKKIVGSIVILGSPLSSYSLAQLLDIPLDAIEDQLDYLHSALRIPLDSNEPVQLLHLSFRDFLVDPEKGGRPEEFPFWIDEHRTHSQLALDCLRLLSTGTALKQDICNLKHPGMARTEVDQKTIDACLAPEVQYACRYWVFHWKGSKQTIQDDDQVHRFLTSHLLCWLEALSLLGNMSESLLMINDLVELLHDSNSCEIERFLRDTQCVITSYGSVVDSRPLQIYCTVTVFAPYQSIVRRTFSHLFPNWISSPPQVESSWGACLATLEGHSAGVHTVAFSPDSSWLASGSEDHTVKLWDAKIGALRTTLKGHIGKILAIAPSPDSSQIASVSGDGTVKLWDTTTGACITTFDIKSFMVSVASFSPDLRWLSWPRLSNGDLKLWEIGPSHDTVSLEGHIKPAHAISFSYDSSRLASGSEDRTIKLWDIEAGINLAKFEGHSGHIFCVAFSPNSHWLASGSADRTVKLWDIGTEACVATFESHRDYISSVAFSPGSNWLASSSETIKLWDIETGVCKATYETPGGIPSTIAFSPDSNRLASGSTSNTIGLWDMIRTYNEALENHTVKVSIMEISPDSRYLTTLASDNTISLWDITGAFINIFKGHKDTVSCIKFSQDSKWFASGSHDSSIRLWDIAGAYRATLRGHYASVSRIAISPDSSWLASISKDKTIKVWDTATATCLATVRDSIDHLLLIRISPDSRWFASGLVHGRVRLWENTGAGMVTLIGHHRMICAIAISSDSKWVASASRDKSIKLWDMTGACTATLECPVNDNSCLAFSPDSNWLASASFGETLKLWDTATGACVANIDYYMTKELHLEFSRDGSKIYMGTAAFTLADYISPSVSGADAGLRDERCDIGVSLDGNWATCNSRNILWLPPTYRSRGLRVVNSTLASVRDDHDVFTITFRSATAIES